VPEKTTRAGKEDYRDEVRHFLELCAKNKVVTTYQQLEKFRTFGGQI